MSDQPQGAGWWQASDGKWYPPQPPTAPPAPPSGPPPPGQPYATPYAGGPQYGMAPMAPPKQGMSGCLKAVIVVGVLALLFGGGCVVVLLVAGEDVADNIEESSREARREVRIASCEQDPQGNMVAELQVSNGSSDRSNYVISVGFRADDGTESLESVTAFVNGVASGATVTDTATSLTPSSDELECVVLNVVRFSDEPNGD